MPFSNVIEDPIEAFCIPVTFTKESLHRLRDPLMLYDFVDLKIVDGISTVSGISVFFLFLLFFEK